MLKDITEKTLNNFGGHRALDPAWFTIIFEILEKVFGQFMDCDLPIPEALEISNRPNRRQKRILRRNIRRELGRKDYRKYGTDMYNALLKSGRNLTEDEVTEIYEEMS